MLNKFDKKLVLIMTGALLIRVVGIILFGDTVIDKEWGIILQNLNEKGILSVREVKGVPVPNIFMPPLYPFFLYIIKIITNITIKAGNHNFVFLNKKLIMI